MWRHSPRQTLPDKDKFQISAHLSRGQIENAGFSNGEILMTFPGEMIICMLRRASLDLDVNRINMAGMTALHQVDP